MELTDSVRLVDPAKIDSIAYKKQIADCIILTKNHQILLQQRTANWGRFGGYLTAFGGHIEPGETPLQGLIRELQEELGAKPHASDIVSLGAITEAETQHTEIVHIYFWHDKEGTITGCYECEAVYYDRVAGALAHPKIMDYLRVQLAECQKRGLLKSDK